MGTSPNQEGERAATTRRRNTKGEKAMKAPTLCLFLLSALSVIITVPAVFADEDELGNDERGYE